MDRTNDLDKLLRQIDRKGASDHAHVAWIELARRHGAKNVQLGALRNRCQQRRCDYQRRQCRQQLFSQNQLEDLESSRTVEGDVLAHERQAVVKAEVEGLPPNMATVIRRCILGGESIKRVAIDLNCPEGTIKSWLHRAKELLRESPRLASLAS